MTTPENTLRIGIPDPGPSFRGALKSRDFTLLFAGQVGAAIGNGLVQLALPFLVLQLTGSALQLGVAYFFQFLPMLLFGILGGVFVDRWDRRWTIIAADVIRAIGFLSVGTIYYLDSLSVAHLYAVIFLESSLANFFNPARAALMPNLVSPENLRPANSLMEVSRHIGFLVAPSVGGILVALIGPAALMLVDGFTFLISAITVFFIKWRQPPREQRTSENIIHAAQIVAEQMAEGFAVIGRSQLLQVAVLLGFCLNMIVAPIQVLLPLFVIDIKHEGPAYYAALVTGLLTGLIVGSISAPAMSRRVGLGKLTIGGVTILGVVIAIAAWPPTILPPLAAMVIAGIAIGSLNVAQTTMLQDATTDEERGRVSATYFTMTLGVRPLSFLAVGALAEMVDVRFIFVALGLAALSLGGFLSRMKQVREHH